MNESDAVDVTTQPSASHPATDAPKGMRRHLGRGEAVLDAMAGRASVFGFGYRPLVEAIQRSAEGDLGDGSVFGCEDVDGELHDNFSEALNEWLGDTSGQFATSLLCQTADHAVEAAIAIARQARPDQGFRTIAMVGSDHGRTGVCRTASGRPELHEGYGPMMAGFAHVPSDDLDAAAAVIDHQTACVLLSPIDFQHAARPCSAQYLQGLRQLCDQHQALLVFDETQIVLGASGRPFSFQSIADVAADLVIVSSGLFAGLLGGVVLSRAAMTDNRHLQGCPQSLSVAVATETLRAMSRQGILESASQASQPFAVALAEVVSTFEFVRDVNALGMTVGIETDLPAEDLVRVARQRGLRVEPAGDTSVRLQPPLLIDDQDRESLRDLLQGTMQSLARDTSEMSI